MWRPSGPGCVRQCPTLPHPSECSTIGAVGLSFRVRYGTGRFPYAMAAETLFHRSRGSVSFIKACCLRYYTVGREHVVATPLAFVESKCW